jgi:preprotein translocase subunit SecE
MFNKITTFLKEVQLEMKKVNWPTREQTIRYTLMVIGVAAAVAIFLGSFDFIFSELRNCYLLRDAESCYIGRLFEF